MKAVRYTYVRTIGSNFHRVEVYPTYSEANGLEGDPLFEFEHTRAREVRRELGKQRLLLHDQLVRVGKLMKYKEDGIITHDLKFHKY